MKDRIRFIMESEALTPSEFADKLQIGRAVISHILNGRNNPSLDVVTRILSKMNYINPEWLLSGTGEMYKTANDTKDVNTPIGQKREFIAKEPDLFSQNYVSTAVDKGENEYRKEKPVEEPEKVSETSVKEPIIYQKVVDRKITKIIIYYSDNTFETFNADNRPL